MIVLHDTAGPTLSGAEATLKQRRLGYHYMIEKDGTTYEYAKPDVQMSHAAGFNARTVSISFVGGYVYGYVTELQMEAVIRLINERIKPLAPSIRYITGHKHVSPGRKVDPRFPGEPPEGVDLAKDAYYMSHIAHKVGLTFKNKF